MPSVHKQKKSSKYHTHNNGSNSVLLNISSSCHKNICIKCARFFPMTDPEICWYKSCPTATQNRYALIISLCLVYISCLKILIDLQYLFNTAIIVFRWKSRNDEIFSVAVLLLEITGQPRTFEMPSCILGSK